MRGADLSARSRDQKAFPPRGAPRRRGAAASTQRWQRHFALPTKTLATAPSDGESPRRNVDAPPLTAARRPGRRDSTPIPRLHSSGAAAHAISATRQGHASALLAAAGEQTLREKLRRDAHGTGQTFVARQRRAARPSYGHICRRVYRVSPTRNPADYDPEELCCIARRARLARRGGEGAAVLAAPVRRAPRAPSARVRPSRPTKWDGPCAKRRSAGNARRRWACRLRSKCSIHCGTRRSGATNHIIS